MFVQLTLMCDVLSNVLKEMLRIYIVWFMQNL